MKVSTSNLTRRYVAALSLVALLSCVAFLSLRAIIENQRTSAAVVNVSGRQRMLSQRISRYALLYVTTENAVIRTQLYEILSQDTDLFEESHQGLVEGGIVGGFHGSPQINLPGAPSPAVQAIYFDAPLNLDQQVKTYVDEIRALLASPEEDLTLENPHLLYILEAASTPIIDSLNLVVDQYQKESQAAVARLQLLETVVLAITLTTLLLEGLFIFRPMVRQVVGTTEQLQTTNEKLRENNQLAEIRQQELTLAADVGNSLSQMRSLDELLSNAVETIRTRFNLYYTQVYLLSPDGKTLNLSAGTGTVGQQLLQRRHRLLANIGSINGRAFIEKQPIIVADTQAASFFLPNPLLPETRSEMAMPLIVGERVVGVLDMQSTQPGALSEKVLPALQALAGQLAIAIQNAELFAEAEKARREIAAYANRLTQTGWQNYLDAVQIPERIGFMYQNGTVTQAPDLAVPSAPQVVTPIQVVEAPIGMFAFEGIEYLTEAQVDLVTNLSRQVAQRLENLRLLAEAERYRTEAETTLRRLTRDGWDTFRASSMLSEDGFVFAKNQVRALYENEQSQELTSVYHPLVLNGEAIGTFELGLSQGQKQLEPETTELVASIAEALTTHIENLRLTRTTETALAQTETQARRLAQLNEMSTALNKATRLEDLILLTLEETPKILGGDVSGVALLTPDEQFMEAYVNQDGKLVQIVAPEGTVIPLAHTSAEQVIQTRQIVIVPDTRQSSMLDLQDMARNGMVTAIQAPLILGASVLGVLNVMSFSPMHQFTEQDAALLQQVSAVVATTIENLRLLQQATKRAERETLINTINQRVQSATTVEGALEVAAQEIGHLLRARYAAVEISLMPQNSQ
ncbi:MAG: GAF domain-containing protein [Anaerolineales bacterium]|nr:GAF domain-containing protein [Anaerolineales bacterium]